VIDGQALRNHAAEREAEHVSAREVGRLEQAGEVGGHLLDPKARVVDLGAPDAAVVEEKELEMVGEVGEQRRPEAHRAAQPADEHQRGPFALDLVVQALGANVGVGHG
jgi:hypothetical protein